VAGAAGTCNDVAEPVAANPPRVASAGEAFIGNGSTFFVVTAGHRWRENVTFEQQTYQAKVGVYTLDSKPPRITLRRVDGPGVGRVEFFPETGGLPGWLPTRLYFPSVGCWEVTARGTKGQAKIFVYVEPRRPVGTTTR
jgi:hypothetical protein